MRHKTRKESEWQEKGGTFTIPDGWFVTIVDLDAAEPYCVITNNADLGSPEKRIFLPKSLAYYLGTHFCGSNVMRELIQEDTRQSIRNTIKDALGL